MVKPTAEERHQRRVVRAMTEDIERGLSYGMTPKQVLYMIFIQTCGVDLKRQPAHWTRDQLLSIGMDLCEKLMIGLEKDLNITTVLGDLYDEYVKPEEPKETPVATKPMTAMSSEFA